MLAKIYAALMIVLAMIGGTSSPQHTTPQALPAEMGGAQQEVRTESDAAPLSQNQAEEIALQAFGLQRADVFMDRTELDYEKGQPIWEVEFHRQGSEYELEIHAQTGEILRAKPQIQSSEEQQPTEQPSKEQQSTEQPSEGLSKEQALHIALEHAGLSREQIKRLKIEKDHEKNSVVYEIEFKNGIVEYEYEIRMSDGKILEWDKEIDD